MSERTVRVPLAVDAQIRIPIGPMNLPIRAVVMLGLAGIPAYLCFYLGFLSPTLRFAAAGVFFLVAFVFSTPMQQGIWIGTIFFFRLVHGYIPSVVHNHQSMRAVVRTVGEAVHIGRERPVGNPNKQWLALPQAVAALKYYGSIPKVPAISDGIFQLKPGGFRAVVAIDGPAVSVASDTYLHWCQGIMDWLAGVDCPAQFITLVSHFDALKAEATFDDRAKAWPRTPLKDIERELAGDIAGQSLGLRHYVVFSPKLAPKDGMPYLSSVTRVSSTEEATSLEADRILQSALRIAPSFAVEIRAADHEEIAELVSQTILGAQDAGCSSEVLHMNGQHHQILTVLKLPPRIEVGVVVEALMRARAHGVASLHIIPVDVSIARKALNKQAKMYKYAANSGNDDIDTQVAIADTTETLTAMAQRSIRPMRVALTVDLAHPQRQEALAAAERFEGIMMGYGFELVNATVPGFLPALAVAPGWAPLGRSVLLTADVVALRMIPALGTPFSDSRHPLIGSNALTGTPVYFSVWDRPNHNVVVVGSSGAGKSVATKTLFVRHIMEGITGCIIDPDSEYRPVITAVGGDYFELGEDALNPLAAGINHAPDSAASLVMPILSVMSGDEKGIREGRPIRRLTDEDQGWLHAEVAEFYRLWAEHRQGQEPLLSNLLQYLDTDGKKHALTEQEAERCRIICARLRRYTQGKRATVFDRPSTFAIGSKPVGIGMKTFAMSYGADLTPALAVVLVNLLAALDRKLGRMIIVVDEAHRVTCDPDAGEVLGQLVRQARKYGAGVWMCSQKVEDFIETDLGKTLAATAATKLVLGTEDAVVEQVAEVFKLRPEEAAAISPLVQGRGVLISGGERAVVQVVPGPAIMFLADTSSAIRAVQTESAA